MKKSVLFIILLFAVGMTAQAQKFALIDMEYILKNIPAYERAIQFQRYVREHREGVFNPGEIDSEKDL